jgi:hypothetical protein
MSGFGARSRAGVWQAWTHCARREYATPARWPGEAASFCGCQCNDLNPSGRKRRVPGFVRFRREDHNDHLRVNLNKPPAKGKKNRRGWRMGEKPGAASRRFNVPPASRRLAGSRRPGRYRRIAAHEIVRYAYRMTADEILRQFSARSPLDRIKVLNSVNQSEVSQTVLDPAPAGPNRKRRSG